jgi:membrane-bound lytic murein transglycosylase C
MWQKNQRNGIARQSSRFSDYRIQSQQEFRQWQSERNQRYADFMTAVAHRWGNAPAPTKTCWVEYGSDTASVCAVDFMLGRATVSVVTDSATPRAAADDKLVAAIIRTIASTGEPDAVPLSLDTVRSPVNLPILHSQVRDCNGRIVSPSTASSFATALLDSAHTDTIHPVTGATTVVTSVQFNLIPNHLQVRMAPYLTAIRDCCRRYAVNEALVLATIHTESYFNPMAISGCGAIGLMQLMPDLGGREAYALVYGCDASPTDQLLFDPVNNIELGCAYISLLQGRYFGAVTNPASRRYCSIAGYNAGPGTVAVVFTTRPVMQAAADCINAIADPEMVFQTMVRNLPCAETRDYLGVVRQRMELYQ